jgi:hypothetical protein
MHIRRCAPLHISSCKRVEEGRTWACTLYHVHGGIVTLELELFFSGETKQIHMVVIFQKKVWTKQSFVSLAKI